MELLLDIPAEHARNIFGELDVYARLIEKELQVDIVQRNGSVVLRGPDPAPAKARVLLRQLLAISMRGNPVTEQNVRYALSLLEEEREANLADLDKEVILQTVSGRPVRPKTLGQKTYVESIRRRMVTFGIGPAGTGKTYLAMAMAVKAFRNNEVTRIILTRPAIEAGEKLGFLPGDLQSKIDPYLRPLYDALYEIMGPETFLKNSEKGLIEVAPLAYMRGRTLDNAFIILDEAQNTTPAQMKMFLTRIGFGTKVVITGDRTQKDLPKGTESGLDVAAKVLAKIDEIGFIQLTAADVVRHPLVQKIVTAYEAYERKALSNTEKRRVVKYARRNDRK
ncbi:MAG: PhoH family protein [Lachnospiraceae bacterium]